MSKVLRYSLSLLTLVDKILKKMKINLSIISIPPLQPLISVHQRSVACQATPGIGLWMEMNGEPPGTVGRYGRMGLR